MLDIKFIRENADLIKTGARKKHLEIDLEKLLLVDDRRRAVIAGVEEMRAKQNEYTDLIAQSKDVKERERMIREMKDLKTKLQTKEKELEPIMKEWRSLMLTVPNVPDVSVPEGSSDAGNQEIKQWGEKKKFDFPAKSHIEIMKMHDMVDLERGVEVAGFRGYFLKNDGANLSFAVWNYAREFWTKRGFEFMIVPSLVKKETLYGSGYLPQGEDDLYKTQDDEYLAGTGEVATMAYFSNQTLKKTDLPKKILAFSPCFRREAGAHGKDVKGLIRVHEFFKMEQVVLSPASHEESVKYHEEINGNAEAFIESLEIPYHTVTNCGADLGLGQVKKYDIELWVPGEGKYREISSASYFHDFQTRRLNIKYRDDDGKLHYAHSLNCTAIPTPRILVSLVENYQQEDGSIKIPKALQSYMGKEVISKR